MNEQLTTNPDNIEWTRIVAMCRGVRWQLRGYTSNPIAGCNFGCQFVMPDGNKAECYAKTIAERTMVKRAYNFGFEHFYWRPNELETLRKWKKSCGVFVGSMGDIMDAQVPHGRIHQLLEVMHQTPWITYFILTKQASRLKLYEYPDNAWVGVSMPPTSYQGKPVSVTNYLHTAFDTLSQLKASVKWMSLEPLSFDMSEWLVDAPIQWAVLGAATYFNKTYQPDPAWINNAVWALHGREIPVFYKGNLKGNPATTKWLEEFPTPSIPCKRCGEKWFGAMCPACNEVPKEKADPATGDQLTLF